MRLELNGSPTQILQFPRIMRGIVVKRKTARQRPKSLVNIVYDQEMVEHSGQVHLH